MVKIVLSDIYSRGCVKETEGSVHMLRFSDRRDARAYIIR